MSTKPDVIATHNGVNIVYNERFGTWQAQVGNKTHSATQLSELRTKLDNIKKFKPRRLRALWPNAGELFEVEITSWEYAEARFSYKDKHGHVERDKTYGRTIFDATDENRKLWQELQPLRQQIRTLTVEANKIEARFSRKEVDAHQKECADGARGKA